MTAAYYELALDAVTSGLLQQFHAAGRTRRPMPLNALSISFLLSF